MMIRSVQLRSLRRVGSFSYLEVFSLMTKAENGTSTLLLVYAQDGINECYNGSFAWGKEAYREKLAYHIDNSLVHRGYRGTFF